MIATLWRGLIMNNKSTRYSCTHVWPTFTLHQFHISHPYKKQGDIHKYPPQPDEILVIAQFGSRCQVEREPLEWNQWKVRELLKRKYGTEPWFTESLSAAAGTSEAVLYLPPSRGVHFPAFVKITGIYWQLWNGNRTACYSS